MSNDAAHINAVPMRYLACFWETLEPFGLWLTQVILPGSWLVVPAGEMALKRGPVTFHSQSVWASAFSTKVCACVIREKKPKCTLGVKTSAKDVRLSSTR